MTDDELSELRSLNEARAAAGDRTAAIVMRLVDHYLMTAWQLKEVEEKLRAAVGEIDRKRELIRGLCDRVEAQAQLLSRRAEK